MHGEAKFSVSTAKHSAMHYIRTKIWRFVLRESIQEWRSVTFSDKSTKRCQRTEDDNGLFSHYCRGATSSSVFRFKRNGHFFNRQDGTNSSYYTVHLKNVQHSSKNGRRHSFYIPQSAHTVVWALFYIAPYIMHANTRTARRLALKRMP